MTPLSPSEQGNSVAMTRLDFRVPAALQAEIRKRAAERDRTVSEYLRWLAEGPPPDVRLSELQAARYRMALEAIIAIKAYDAQRVYDIATVALKDCRS